MKIGFVLDDGLDSTDGIQQNILTLGAWLRVRGHEVHYLVGETKRTDLEHVHSMSRNIKVSFNGNALTIPLPTRRRKITFVLDELSLDVIHIQTPYSPFMGGKVLRHGHTRSATVSTFHILAYTKLVVWASSVLRLLNLPTSRYIDAHVAVSAPAEQFARQTYGYRDVVVLPNPFDYQRFFVEPTISDGKQPVHVVFLGRLVPRKGAMELLRAVEHLLSLTKRPFVVTVGGKGAELARLQAFVEERGLSDVVRFAGFVAEEDKVAFLAQADVVVFPSISGESFGISLLEGMASARGVVLAGDNPGYTSVMSPDFAGQLMNPKDTEAFAHTLAHWLESAEARHNVAQAQKQYVRQFDVEVVGPKLLRIYEETLQKRRKQA